MARERSGINLDVRLHLSGNATLSAYQLRVAELGALGEEIMARSLNTAGDQVRTLVRRALRAQTGVKRAETITKAVSSIPARPNTSRAMTYEIVATGKGLRIEDFPVSASAGGPVTATVWGVARTFQRSFVTKDKGLLRARRGSAREPIRSLRGPSPSKELVAGESAKTFDHAIAGIVEPILIRRLAQLLP